MSSTVHGTPAVIEADKAVRLNVGSVVAAAHVREVQVEVHFWKMQKFLEISNKQKDSSWRINNKDRCKREK